VPQTFSRYRGTAASRGYTYDWQCIRLKALHRDNYCCVECAKQGKLIPAEAVDHIIPITNDPSLRLVLTNLQSLCRKHHQAKTFSEQHQPA